MRTFKSLLSRLKPYLRWLVLGATLFFLASAIRQHWQEVAALRLDAAGWGNLAIALGITLLAHVWSGWVWSWILWEFEQPVPGSWGILKYLKTNIAKYLPGNVWQFYGRVVAAKQIGIPLSVATLSVLLEPLLMAAAALAIALIGVQSGNLPLQFLCLLAVLIGIHPRILNTLLQLVGRMKGKPKEPEPPQPETATPAASSSPDATSPSTAPKLRRYPLLPLLGEAGFVLLRGSGFIFTLLALGSIAPGQIFPTLSAFSFAWVLGLVVPGAPGGIGVFEATAVALLSQQFSPGMILGSVALYRLISVLAEAIGAGLAWLIDDRQSWGSKG